jgi:thermolabile hemolysin
VYLQETLHSAPLTRPEETAFLIWAGANDYISKEPINGLITTFLNTPEDEHGYESVVNTTLAGIFREVRALHSAGARRFILVNLPDLGRTPIPLQNDTYVSGSGIESEEGRRIELSRRLSVMTDYHNTNLVELTKQVKAELADVDILLVDSNGLTDSIMTGHLFDNPQSAFDYGFALDTLQQELEYDGHKLNLPNNCYTGLYLGSREGDNTCEAAATALFWDVVHPGTYGHCWQAYQIARVLSDAGWIPPLSAPEDYRAWCQGYLKRDPHD